MSSSVGTFTRFYFSSSINYNTSMLAIADLAIGVKYGI